MKSQSFLTPKWFFIALITLSVFTFGYSLTASGQEPLCPKCPVDPCGGWTSDRPLIAGSNEGAGRVFVCNDNTYLYVTYYVDNWLLRATHLAVATSLEGIPSTKSGNPIPGQFPYHSSHEPPLQYACYTHRIELGNWIPGTTLYIAAHAVVYCDIFDQEETAWRWGRNYFPSKGKKKWSMFSTYIVKSCE